MSEEEKQEGSPRFRNKPLEVSLYEHEDDVNYTPVFEGQTSSISREGVGVRVNPRGKYKSIDREELEGKKFIIKFHTAVRSAPTPTGTVEMVGESHDMRYKTYLGFTFEEQLPLHNIFR